MRIKKWDAPNYAFDNGVLTLALTEAIEQSGKHWVSEREKQTIGQCFYSLNRQALANLLSLSENLFAQGQSSKNILELLMPA